LGRPGGTPRTLIASGKVTPKATTSRTTLVSLPASFNSHLAGSVAETQTSSGSVDVRIDATLSGGIDGRLRLVLEGTPLQGGGVSMTASGVAFAAAGSPVYEGRSPVSRATTSRRRWRPGRRRSTSRSGCS